MHNWDATAGRRPTDDLIERDADLALLLAGLDEVVGRLAPQLMAIYAPVGVGKTALMQALGAAAAARGVHVLHAAADEQAGEEPFAVVADLLEPLAQHERRERWFAGRAAAAAQLLTGRGTANDGQRLGKSLQSLMRNLSADGPLLVAVDDAHWADDASLGFLHGLRRHLSGSPVFVVVAACSDASESVDGPLVRLLADPVVAAVRPRPLSVAAVERLVRRSFPEASARACRACHAATAGNPFFLHELLRELEIDGRRPDDEQLEAAGARAVARWVRGRVAGLGDEVVALVRAAAVLGDDARLELVAALAMVPEDRAATIADDLIRASLFRRSLRPEFTQPIVRAAVLADLLPHARADLHRRAAELLGDAGAPPSVLARHLVLTSPEGVATDADVLRRAARDSLSRGRPEDAVGFLRRAVAEPSLGDERFDALVELVRAALRWQPEQALEALDEAERLALCPSRRAVVAEVKARTLLALDRVEAAVGVLARAADAARDEGHVDVAVTLEAQLASAARLDLGTRPLGLERLARLPRPRRCASTTDAVLLATAALEEGLAGRSVAATRALARVVLECDQLVEIDDPPPGCGLAFALVWCDDLLEADAFLARLQAAASVRGARHLLANATCLRAHVALRAGEVSTAEQLARESLDVLPPRLWRRRLALPVAFLVDALLEQGGRAEAERLLAEHGFDERAPRFWEDLFLVDARARLRLAVGAAAQALADADRCAHRAAAWRLGNPVALRLAETRVTALRLLGRKDEARAVLGRFADDVGRWPTSRARGSAVWLAATLAPTDAQVELYRRSEEALREGPAVLERARTLIGLAGAHRRAGARREARDELTHALHLCERQGATDLAAWARAELAALGTHALGAERRPSGLTPGEWRVVQLALEGLENRQIARQLFVTVKTVEAHLTRSYRKLGVHSRHELRHVFGTVATASDGTIRSQPAAAGALLLDRRVT